MVSDTSPSSPHLCKDLDAADRAEEGPQSQGRLLHYQNPPVRLHRVRLFNLPSRAPEENPEPPEAAQDLCRFGVDVLLAGWPLAQFLLKLLPLACHPPNLLLPGWDVLRVEEDEVAPRLLAH